MDFDDEEMDVPEERKQKNPLVQSLKIIFNSVFLTLCRPFNSHEISVEKNTIDQRREYYRYEQISDKGLLLLTENFLQSNLIRNLRGYPPKRVLEIIEEFYRISRDSSYLLIAADICRFFSENVTPRKQIAFHLSAYRYSCQAFLEKDALAADQTMKGSLLAQGMQILNEAIAGIFTYLRDNHLLDSNMFVLKGIDGTEFVLEKQTFRLSVPRSAVSEFSLCSDHSVKALRMVNRHSGLGVPLVAKISSASLSHSLKTPAGLTIPVTVLFRAKFLSERRMSLQPFYLDTSSEETFCIEENSGSSRNWVLARDFTTPLACFMNDLPQRNLLSGMLHPVSYDEYTGLYMLEPYHPGRIPLVFIHGLMSSPETWGEMINTLKYNPEIRQKYQFWFFSYSTGTPVLYSAKKLRTALLDAQAEFCTTPEAVKTFERMVLVGHSMGGLVARLLLQENPYCPLETSSGKPHEEIRNLLNEKEWQSLCDFCVLPSLPFVKRAVFMSVPHRGSAMAQRSLAKLGITLIRMPYNLLRKADDLTQIAKKCCPDLKISWKEGSFITGIDNLDPEGVFVKWLMVSSIKKDVTVHSIIGNKKTTAPGGSDGVVPYQSSHLNDVASECIVKSDHSVHRAPAAIREVMRILLLHLKSSVENH